MFFGLVMQKEHIIAIIFNPCVLKHDMIIWLNA